jgi:DNA-binding NarL/FixJ family response regulator
MAQEPSRIVVADDDHPLFRSALKHILEGQPDLEVVAEAADGRQALELCRRLTPDLVLMDLGMPEMDGIAATRAIKEECPDTLVLVLTALGESSGLSRSSTGLVKSATASGRGSRCSRTGRAACERSRNCRGWSRST